MLPFGMLAHAVSTVLRGTGASVVLVPPRLSKSIVLSNGHLKKNGLSGFDRAPRACATRAHLQPGRVHFPKLESWRSPLATSLDSHGKGRLM